MTSDKERLLELDRMLRNPALDSRIRSGLFNEGAQLWEQLEQSVWGERGLAEGWMKPVGRWRGMPHERMVASVQSHRPQWARFHTELQRCREQWHWDPVVAFAGALRGLPQGATVADFGAGDGRLGLMLREARPDLGVRSFDLLAWDDSVEVADIASTPLGADSVDAVVLSCALWGDSGQVLAECLRVLKIGGCLLLAEPQSHWEEGELESVVRGAGLAVGSHGQDPDERFEYLQAVKTLSI